ncbi:MAG: preprotein translocase subunit SecG [Candidatus Magasanikbacteria bacterium]|uniref:Protein-export membrane protein SecG n=1 Tax=Candidatus Magasanikbacteria bacterium CG10_big_fil_rev_8_21_14_0_10_38_6 TaxID=1974647 RepID=A0A2M6P261_9BACT|nr:preprotein translocase subunit SecG [Candidatus Magasanikbacteria bacterium]PIR77774.1 MAG: preprotein translocase subunit SecG [Candidatus Magasanikbacteria bacterium CG10_big_fil_rev_8_21_14_0_10_38_6]
MLQNLLWIAEVVLGILLIIIILIQHKGAGLGAGFGNTGTAIASTKRGVDLFLHRMTIAASILFFGIACVAILI